MNAKIIKTQILPFMKFDHKGHGRSYKVTFLKFVKKALDFKNYVKKGFVI